MTAGQHEPWWASGADALDPDVDALRAHREARGEARPWEEPQAHDQPPPPGSARSVLEDAVEGLAVLARLAGTRRGRAGDRTGAGQGRQGQRPHDPACRGCPWCTLLRAVGDSRPEVVEHLGEAMRHLTLAARAVLEATEERGGWEPIPLDDDPPGGR